MIKQTPIVVPKGIRYLSQWGDFSIPDHPCIINKQITGCGFTEFCITNNENVILCSPRKILLENKESQHVGQVYYIRNDLDTSPKVDIDLNRLNRKSSESDEKFDIETIKREVNSLKLRIQSYINSSIVNQIPAKILVTYDSFRLVKEAINELEPQGVNIDQFRVIVDEWQAIFVDSTFKSNTELEFVSQLQDLRRVCFVSATPYIEDYLNDLDEFKDLPYYELDWKTAEPLRVNTPFIESHPCSKSILSFACDIIDQYRKGEGEVYSFSQNGQIREIQSREAVIYVNSVKNICDIIRKANLTLDETNVLCSRDSSNNRDVKAAFGLKGRGIEVLGRVPRRGEHHKMFTLCTRTVYLGADFYSTNAKTYVFADANVDSLTVDISLDLPQILGRQRLDENPWKHRAEVYYKTINEGNIETEEQLEERLQRKDKRTENLLLSYKNSPTADSKHDLAEKYQKDARTSNYRDDYVAVNVRAGGDLVPVFNKYVRISEKRAWEIQQNNYKNNFSVFGTMEKEGNNVIISDIDRFIMSLGKYKTFPEKMKQIYDACLPPELAERVLSQLPIEYGNFYRSISPEEARRLSYRKGVLGKRYERHLENQDVDSETLKELIYDTFVVGSKYTKADAKVSLGSIYDLVKYNRTPKATDLDEYFELKRCAISVDGGKRAEGFEIIKKK